MFDGNKTSCSSRSDLITVVTATHVSMAARLSFSTAVADVSAAKASPALIVRHIASGSWSY